VQGRETTRLKKSVAMGSTTEKLTQRRTKSGGRERSGVAAETGKPMTLLTGGNTRSPGADLPDYFWATKGNQLSLEGETTATRMDHRTERRPKAPKSEAWR